MTRRWFSLLSLLMAASLVLPLLSAPVTAQSLDELRASGKVGERYDGFAVARDGSYADMVKDINAKRGAIYKEQAAKQGVGADQVGKVYAAEIVKQVPKGTWILTADGKWLQK
ncbi:MAG: YdbL family protein [Kiloniellaceae bacterium]